MLSKKTLSAASIACCMSVAAVEAEPREPIASWVQYTASGVEARSVVNGPCPRMTVDGDSVKMSVRALPIPDHVNKVCSAKVKEGAETLTIAGENYPVPKNNPETILVIGDTGCRVSSSHGLYQACNNSSEWPFKRLAKSAASQHPDLIIYTGDYIYREAPCPEGNSGCKDTPYGDNKETWEADWLIPAQSLHTAAPMILTRGNHETCSRAGKGWYRYLDARPYYRGKCILNNRPWIADLGSHSVAVMDTANLKDADGNDLTGRFENELIELNERLDEESWIMTHRPFWGYGADDTGEFSVQEPILQEAVRDVGLPDTTNLLISAHIHLSEILEFENSQRPIQMIIGNGGTQLVSDVEPIDEIDGEKIEEQRVLNQFGYAIMKKKGSRIWEINFHDQDGYLLERCTLKNKAMKCH
ncbi:MAG TPA: hypothetical protein EYQ44_10765 [Porticoccaceae bacterium]|nr:hypothetical protein [Porticoccaceae bacterium]